MIKLYADYHTHTIYSHGRGSIYDNAAAACKKGLKEIAISDHGPGHYSFGIKKSDLIIMREEVDRINCTGMGIKVLLGVEANLTSMDGDIDIDDEDMKYLDLLLVGYHTAVKPASFREIKGLYLDNLGAVVFSSIYNKAREQNTRALIRAMEKRKIDIITHPGAKIPIDTAALARAAAKTGTALEINSHHGFLNVEYVKIAEAEGAMFVINSDAHSPSSVGEFSNGITTAEKAGLPAERIINADLDQE